jgi:hypothetical protein
MIGHQAFLICLTTRFDFAILQFLSQGQVPNYGAEIGDFKQFPGG